MIVSSLGAAYAPQTVISKSRLPLPLPRAPIAPVPKAPRLPTMPTGPSGAYSRQPAPVQPPVTTPESADVMEPATTYTLPGYGYPSPQQPPDPSGASTRWGAEDMATATEPTVEYEQPGTLPANSIDAQMQAEVAAATPWYMNKTYWLIGGAVAVGLFLLRK